MTIKELMGLYTSASGFPIEVKEISWNDVEVITTKPLPKDWQEYLKKNYNCRIVFTVDLRRHELGI